MRFASLWTRCSLLELGVELLELNTIIDRNMSPWKPELCLWFKFIVWYRVVPIVDIVYEPTIEVVASTDACSTGAGFVCANRCFMYKFKDEWNRYGDNHRRMHINMQQMHAVIQMLHTERYNLTSRTL